MPLSPPRLELVAIDDGYDFTKAVARSKGARIPTGFEDFPYHPANLAVAMDAIRRVVEPGTPVHVIAGVPLNRFYLPPGDINTEVSAKKTQAWSRGVKALRGAALPRIPNAVFSIDPQMANARGMLKFGVTVAGFDARQTT